MPRRRDDRSAALRAMSPTPWNRRDALRIGGLTVSGALTTGTASAAPAPPAKSPKAQSVIYLMMMGGVTHIDSFDPKPHAPEEIRGTLAAIATRLPGVQFSEAMPRLAAIADRLTLVRSYSHTNNDHLMSQAFALSGRNVGPANIKTEPNIGSIVSFLHGPRNHLPAYIAVPGITRPGPPPNNLFGGGWLGGQHDPFRVGGEPDQPDFTATEKLENPAAEVDEQLTPRVLQLRPELDVDRLARRSQLRTLLDARLRAAERQDAFTTLDAQWGSALHLLSSTRVRHAFDLADEPAALRERYGRTKIGGRCLLARRLVEAGARFVMVDYGYDNDYGNLWDQHNVSGQHYPHTSEMAKRGYHVAGIDRAFAGLITDLDERGLLDSTLVVFMTEFGRTPKINKNGGRDHWAPACSMFFAGGGSTRGQVIGATDRQGAYPTSPGYSPADIIATIYRAIGIDPSTRLYDRQRRPLFVLPHGDQIPGVLA
ncbi:MAG TPA: DUF1501 domain-containing protein [Pirellulales bacterium]